MLCTDVITRLHIRRINLYYVIYQSTYRSKWNVWTMEEYPHSQKCTVLIFKAIFDSVDLSFPLFNPHVLCTIKQISARAQHPPGPLDTRARPLVLVDGQARFQETCNLSSNIKRAVSTINQKCLTLVTSLIRKYKHMKTKTSKLTKNKTQTNENNQTCLRSMLMFCWCFVDVLFFQPTERVTKYVLLQMSRAFLFTCSCVFVFFSIFIFFKYIFRPKLQIYFTKQLWFTCFDFILFVFICFFFHFTSFWPVI